jgi:hypothetical protein
MGDFLSDRCDKLLRPAYSPSRLLHTDTLYPIVSIQPELEDSIEMLPKQSLVAFASSDQLTNKSRL